jgi:hypothetical protein
MGGLGLVVNLEGFISGGNQIRLGFHAMSVVINHAPASLAELPVDGLLNEQEFFSGQFRQSGLDFGNRTHESNVTVNGCRGRRELADWLGSAAPGIFFIVFHRVLTCFIVLVPGPARSAGRRRGTPP